MSLLTPHIKVAAVEELTPDFLHALGIEALLIDVDNTLVSRKTHTATPQVHAWLAQLKAAGIRCCLLSNNWHHTVLEHAAELGLPVVWRAMKPAPVAFVRALTKIGAHRATTAMVGDQLFTDILGAQLVVMCSILVEPLSTTDLWYTKLFRRLEQRLTRARSSSV